MASQSASALLVSVTKSAVLKTLTTPSMASKSAPSGSSTSSPAKVAGSPTGRPTPNFMALGLGVGSGVTTMHGIVAPPARATPRVRRIPTWPVR